VEEEIIVPIVQEKEMVIEISRHIPACFVVETNDVPATNV
jgi:hypothetical protein